MLKKLLFLFGAAFIAVSVFFATTCDMVYIDDIFGDHSPRLTILGLPANVNNHNFSEIFLYNNAGQIAKCTDINDISITYTDTAATAVIPLTYINNDTPFKDSGTFLVTFIAHIDIYSDIIKTYNDGLLVVCKRGSGTIDLKEDFGYFAGSLVNPYDAEPLTVRKGTKFEMNGSYYTLTYDTDVTESEMDRSSIVYVYASFSGQNVTLEYSYDTPVWDNYKKGYYLDNKRALFKFILIKSNTDIYFAKTKINEDFRHFQYHTNDSSYMSYNSLPVEYTLSGSGDPSPATRTFTPGTYIFILKGASGGKGYYNGGSGGLVIETVNLSKNVNFTLFTGECGKNVVVSSDASYTGYAGGGGGSGTFIYSDTGYFLCAGGGGGGGGRKANIASSGYLISDGGSPGGGGAGGAIGSGAGGGGSGANCFYSFPFTVFVSNGANGGGYKFGTGGISQNLNITLLGITIDDIKTINGSVGNNGSVFIDIDYNFLFSGIGQSYNSTVRSSGITSYKEDTFTSRGYDGGMTATVSYLPPLDWKNTNNANGKGGDFSIAGQDGGNNRNAERGKGTTEGEHGSITVYKVY